MSKCPDLSGGSHKPPNSSKRLLGEHQRVIWSSWHRELGGTAKQDFERLRQQLVVASRAVKGPSFFPWERRFMVLFASVVTNFPCLVACITTIGGRHEHARSPDEQGSRHRPRTGPVVANLVVRMARDNPNYVMPIVMWTRQRLSPSSFPGDAVSKANADGCFT